MTTSSANSIVSRRPQRRSVDLAAYPELVVVYLGLRVGTVRGIAAMLGIGRQLNEIARDMPDGLLAQENLVYGLNHIGLRQYWRDFDALERFTRSDPHRRWWATFSKDPAGTGFWHETYRLKGGMEGIYVGLPAPIGLGRFAPEKPPTGTYESARQRLAA